MKKTLIALGLLGIFAGTASAQTSLTIYGIADAGLVMERGGPAGNVTKLTSGVQSNSRIGFKGSEDLGGGLAAKFVLEAGVNMDTGGFSQGNTAFGRQAYVGFSSPAGSLALGRQYTPHYLALGEIDPFQVGLAGYAPNLMTTVIRTNNTIKYTTPSATGFVGELAYGFGEVAGDTKANRQVGAMVGYVNGPVLVKLAHQSTENQTGTDRLRSTLLGGRIGFGPVNGHLAYGVNKGLGIVDSRDMLVGISAPVGANTFLASYIRKDDRTLLDQDANQWALGYTYALSKRTNLYTSYARITNHNGAKFTVGNNTEPGTGDKAFNLGVRHLF